MGGEGTILVDGKNNSHPEIQIYVAETAWSPSETHKKRMHYVFAKTVFFKAQPHTRF